MKVLNWFKKKESTSSAQTSEATLKCPKCNHDKWYEGPGGGSFGNIECGNCKACFNHMGPFGLHEIK